MENLIGGLLVIVVGEDWRFEWGWADWLGVSVLLLVILFVITVVVALFRKESPLEILKHIVSALGTLFKGKPN